MDKKQKGTKEQKTAEEVVTEIFQEQEISAAELLEQGKKLLAIKAEIAQSECELAERRAELSKLFDELKELRKNAKTEADKIRLQAQEEASRVRREAKEEAEVRNARAMVESNRHLTEARDEAKLIREQAIKEADGRLQEVKMRESSVSTRETKVLSEEQKLRKMEASLAEREENARRGFTVQSEEVKEASLHEAEKIKVEIERLQQEKLDARAKIEAAMEELRERRMAELEATLEGRRAQFERDIEENDKRERALATLELERRSIKAKMDLLQSREDGIDARVEELLKERHGDLLDELDTKRELLNQYVVDIKELKRNYDSLVKRYNDEKNENVETLNLHIAKLNDELKAERTKVMNLEKRIIEDGIDRNNLEEYRAKFADYNDLQQRYRSLSEQYTKLRLEHEKKMDDSDLLAREQSTTARLRKTNDELRRELEAKRVISREERLDAIRRSLPSLRTLDKIKSFGETEMTDELSWLQYIQRQAGLSGIEFSERLLQAYHTSLKIGEWSPLVVLAGVSGTGKSELPRQYALHGGMNFLSVAVKPDWDSPQSLFGYYNSIENKFEPTELLRALYQMQGEVADSKNNQMLMVLLDEMNLAHVELYFSDLLSKFETKRGTAAGEVEYEINLGAGADSEILHISRNVLWTGTMNEDETTKALSDKVIDRSTLITFPRPKKLIGRRASSMNQEAKYYLERALWEQWIKSAVPIEKIDTNLMNELQTTVEDINEKMSELGRNLGHRVWQSIQNYIVNYPEVIGAIRSQKDITKSVQCAFTEAVAFKIMPKLRGVETSGEYADILDEIAGIINDKIPELADDFKKARILPTRIFMWHTAKFLEKTENV